jgi:hypothetical protein
MFFVDFTIQLLAVLCWGAKYYDQVGPDRFHIFWRLTFSITCAVVPLLYTQRERNRGVTVDFFISLFFDYFAIDRVIGAKIPHAMFSLLSAHCWRPPQISNLLL